MVPDPDTEEPGTHRSPKRLDAEDGETDPVLPATDRGLDTGTPAARGESTDATRIPCRPTCPCAGCASASLPCPPTPKLKATRRRFSLAASAILLAFLLAATIWGLIIGAGVKTIHDLLSENRTLKRAIANLTHEDQIGYAKVVSQEERNGKLYTTLRFVETDRDDPARRILEKEYTIEGDVVHFDALIVTFGDRLVMDGKRRSLYLWRRVYGETMSPRSGHPIETPGEEPERYRDLLASLPLKHRRLFWEGIWELANDPDTLRRHDIKALYGNAVYSKLRAGLIYVFRISNTGQVYPETVPDM